MMFAKGVSPAFSRDTENAQKQESKMKVSYKKMGKWLDDIYIGSCKFFNRSKYFKNILRFLSEYEKGKMTGSKLSI